MLTREVGSIVGDDGIRKPEATNNILPEELHYMLSHDFRERHHLYLLRKVVGGNQKEPELEQSS